MKTLVKVCALVCLISLHGFAWNPVSLFRGKTGYWVSVGAMFMAHALDYQTTEQDLILPDLHEGNAPLVKIVQSRKNFVGFKIGAGAVPAGLELWHLHRHPQYRTVETIANWGIAGSVGTVDWHNRVLYLRTVAPAP